MGLWRRLRRLIWPALHVAIATGIAIAAVISIHDVWVTRGLDGLLPLVLVLPILVVQLIVVGVAWGLLFRAVIPEKVPRAVLVQSFVYGWMARYLPGAPGGPAGKFIVLRRAGYSIAGIGSALMYENLLQMGAGALIPAVTFGFIASEWEVAGWVLPMVIVGIISAMSIALLHGVMPLVFRLLQRNLGVADEAVVRAPLRRDLIAPALLLITGAALGGLAFHFVTVAVTGWEVHEVGVTVFVFGLAAFAGWAVPFAPSGAGVREALIVSLLGPMVGPEQALQAAIVARAATVFADAFVGVQYFVGPYVSRIQGSGFATVLNNRA